MIQEIFEPLMTLGRGYIPNLVGAVIVLVLGWLAALVVGAAVRGTLNRTGLGEKLGRLIHGSDSYGGMNFARSGGRFVFYVVMLFVLMAFLQVLKLTTITAPISGLLSQLLEFLPQMLGAAVLVFAAWALASILRMLVSRVLQSGRLGERLRIQADIESPDHFELHRILGEVVYWFIFLLFLPAILSTLSLGGLLMPVQAMLDQFLGFLPNLFAAAVILLVGWFVARILKQIVTHFLIAIRIDSLGEKAGMESVLKKSSLSKIVGIIVYVLVLIPVIVSAMNALQLSTITAPASAMLTTLLGAIPAIFTALLVLLVSYFIAKVLSGLVVSILQSTRFDSVFVHLRLTKTPPTGGSTPSTVLGRLILVTVMLFAVAEAFRLLGFSVMTDLSWMILVIGGRVLFGLLIAAGGIFIANIASDVVRASGSAKSHLLAMVSRIAILVLVGALALQQIGLSGEIINLTFGLTLGAVAVALAIAFGFGGREAAARQIEQWRGQK
ncbi:mechanosensitive ion channel [bacterium]|nr:mechanosensitive ion channel [bacterium]